MPSNRCTRTCCSGSARFRVRLAFALGVIDFTSVAIEPAQVHNLNQRYGGIADPTDRHFIVCARALGLGGDA